MSVQPEVWLPVRGFEARYEVSNLARIRNVESGALLRPAVHRGYEHLSLYRRPQQGETRRVHVLVLEAFCGPAPFVGAEVCHNNGDKTDNRLTNLRWGSHQQNMDDRARHGRQRFGTGVRRAKLDERGVAALREAYRAGKSTTAMAKELGMSTHSIWCAVTGKTWKHVEGAVCHDR